MSNPNTNHFDFEALRSNLEYDDPFTKEFLVLLKKELDVSLSILREQFEAQNMKEIKATAHRIKGTALNGCCNELATLAATLEIATHFKQEIISSLVLQIAAEIEIIKTLIP